MTTFTNTYGAEPMLASVAQMVKDVEMPDTGDYAVHTITLILNGQHGEFDLVIQATDMDTMEEHRFEGIAMRFGGVAGLDEVNL